MKKILFFCIIISFCLIFSESVSYGFALNISPPSFKAGVTGGGATSGTITVTNNGGSDVGIRAYTQDWLYNPDGSKSFHDAGTTPFSCAKWIRLFPRKFQLEAGGKMSVQYIINVPEDAEGGYYAVIFFESLPLGEYGSEEGVVVQFTGRLGTIVYLETEEKTIYNASLDALSITPPQSDKPLEVTLSLENKGNVHLGAQGTLNIIDEEGDVFGKKRFGPLNALPGDTREARVEWFGELEEGTYYAVVTLDIGSEEPIVEERRFNVSFGGAINAFSIDVSKDMPSFSVLVKNTGHLNIDAGGRIELLNENSEVVKNLNLKKSLIAPGQEKELKGTLRENIPQGIYTAKAVISIGDKELIKKEVFVIK